jgi:nucleoside-triphosphatase THEP1
MQIAVIGYGRGEGEAVDTVLSDVARALQSDGFRLAGAVQWNVERVSHARCDMLLEDLATGKRIDASDINRAKNACRLDPYALEDAAGLVAASVTPDVDLVILNRFGKQEASGQGFRAVIEAAIASELPIVLGLNEAYRVAFDAFSGGVAATLANDASVVAGWCRHQIAARRSSAERPTQPQSAT